jgi:AraC-like DNA-binding protein
MTAGQAPMTMARVRSQLGSMLKSDVAVDLLARIDAQSSSFRSFVSRSISVIDVQGGAIDLRKGVSSTSDVHLLCLRRGTVQLAHAEGCTTVEAGQFVAYRGAQAMQFRHEQDVDLLAVFLPGSALERWLPDWAAAEFVAARYQGEGRLSFDIAHDLLDCADQLQDRASVEVVGETVTRLLARALATTSLNDAAEPADLAEARRRRVRLFCRRNLGSPHLSVEVVARGTGLSRAAIHRLFHDQSHTLMQWVQLERLEACRRALTAISPQQPTLTDIALAHGFKTSAHFSAAFRQRYGQSPREYRATLQAADAMRQ